MHRFGFGAQGTPSLAAQITDHNAVLLPLVTSWSNPPNPGTDMFFRTLANERGHLARSVHFPRGPLRCRLCARGSNRTKGKLAVRSDLDLVFSDQKLFGRYSRLSGTSATRHDALSRGRITGRSGTLRLLTTYC